MDWNCWSETACYSTETNMGIGLLIGLLIIAITYLILSFGRSS